MNHIKQHYDFVYLTNTPSFYKLNLCNAIAKENSVLIVLYGYGSEAVNTILKDSKEFKFDYYFLHEGNSNIRNKWLVLLKLVKLMQHIRCRKVIYAGWLALEYNIYAFLSPKKRNVMICESSIFDVSFSGIAGILKKMIINRMGAVLPSGKPHAQLFKSIGFKGVSHITGSVGIFNKPQRKKKEIHEPLRYLYVGRLIPVKNVALLIDEFNLNGKTLTIVGQGYLEETLKRKAKENIRFTGFIDNNKLGEIYQSHDVFILPSYSETWGLVVEEAIYWGLPVIVSDKVGSSIDMVKDLGTGIIFKSKDLNSLHQSLEKMEQNFHSYYRNVEKVDWKERDRRQVEAYTSLLK